MSKKRLLLVCSPGGHFSTMTSLKPFWSQHSREWVTHKSADTEGLLKDQEKVHWVMNQPSRSVVGSIVNFFAAFIILLRARPDFVISTGAAVGVSFIWAAFFLRIPTLYIESISRSRELSLAAKLIEPVVTDLYVQWPELVPHTKRAQYQGMLL